MKYNLFDSVPVTADPDLAFSASEIDEHPDCERLWGTLKSLKTSYERAYGDGWSDGRFEEYRND